MYFLVWITGFLEMWSKIKMSFNVFEIKNTLKTIILWNIIKIFEEQETYY